MQITHEEAQRLIQLRSDQRLDAMDKEILDSHLESCAACGQYASRLQNMELLLRPLLQRQWNRHPLPLSASSLALGNRAKRTDTILLATRIASLSVMLVAFLFSAWQLSQSKPRGTTPLMTNAAPAPMPLTSTLQTISASGQACNEMIYLVQPNDTLASIAIRFSLDVEEIVSANHLLSGEVRPGVKLTLPGCHSTPTGTASTGTMTFTPLLQTLPSTPGG